MNPRHIALLAEETKLRPEQVRAAAELFSQGCTIPFIARYRKEATDCLDEVALATVRDRLEQMEELDKRREAVLASLEERGLLTEDLKAALEGAASKARLEDLYLPFRPKRRTRALIAQERGLAPLADRLLEAASGGRPFDPGEAETFVDPEKGVPDREEALAGARDIVAERAAENPKARGILRGLFVRRGEVRSRVAKGKEEEGAKYRDYFDWTEPARSAPPHRILALLRGEKEGVLSLSFRPPQEEGQRVLEGLFVAAPGAGADQVRAACRDGYDRLAAPSMETELRNVLKALADRKSVEVFARNVREVLLDSPLGQRAVLAVDPGVRTGCKLTCLDPQGRLLASEVVYLHTPRGREEGVRTIRDLLRRHPAEAVAVGNGTGGREAEDFLRELDLPGNPVVVSVSEQGASVYSASEAAREEFPDQDVTVRGSVSIGRRLQDPLAELVKIDPKSLGVGQYQHDVDPKLLRQSLDDVVVSCVNAVGVEVNSASRQLLSYVSGLSPALAAQVVAFREASGPFRTRQDLKKVPRLGPKAFQQAAGFLRIRGGENPLDGSAVHPEHYPLVDRMARDLDCSVGDLLADRSLRERIDPNRYVGPEAGLPTLRDILTELDKPGRDPRRAFEPLAFDPNLRTLEDLAPGMTLPGVVTNVTAFGAFVDVGVHQDGLVHLSHLSDKYVKDPSEAVRPGQRVSVTVLGVDLPRRRLSLSMKKNPRV